MLEKVKHRNGVRIIEVRSDAGKLMYIKTPEGYEMKCPRSKEMCLIPYEKIMTDCIECWNDCPKKLPDVLE